MKKIFDEYDTKSVEMKISMLGPFINMANDSFKRMTYMRDLLSLIKFRLCKYLYVEKKRSCWSEEKQNIFKECGLDVIPDEDCRPSSKKINLLIDGGCEEELRNFLDVILSQFVVITTDRVVCTEPIVSNERTDVIRDEQYKILIINFRYEIIFEKIVNILMNGKGRNILNNGINHIIINRRSKGSIIS